MAKAVTLPKKTRQADKRLTLAVDFDGVIYDPATRQFYPDSLDSLDRLTRRFKIIVFSARAANPAGREFIRNLLLDNQVKVEDVTAVKPMAELYIDDKGLRHTNWTSTFAEIEFRLGLQNLQI